VRYHPAQLPPAVRANVCNGMGPRGGLAFRFLVWLLDWLGPGRVFHAAADVHDLGYALGGTEQDRHEADDQFMIDMAHAWRAHSGLTRWALRAVAHWAHSAVDELGDDLAFHYRPRRLTVAELIVEKTAPKKS